MNHKTNFIDRRMMHTYGKNQEILFRNDDGKRSINVTCYNEGSSPPLEETKIFTNAKRTEEKGENNFLFLDIFEPFSWTQYGEERKKRLFWIKKIHFGSHAAIIERKISSRHNSIFDFKKKKKCGVLFAMVPHCRMPHSIVFLLNIFLHMLVRRCVCVECRFLTTINIF